MKIGLLSLPLNWNYGGMLQQYALKEVMQNMGHEVTVFSRRMDRSHWKDRILVQTKWKTLEFFGRFPPLRFLPLIGVQDFKRRNLPSLTKDLYGDDSLRNVSKKLGIEAFVVGSDQVWNPHATPKIDNYYLDFTHDFENVRRLAYAASFGKSQWQYSDEETKRCRELVKSFDQISVRESSGVSLCKEHLAVDASLMPDPALLLTREDYRELIARSSIKKQPNSLLTYILDDSASKTSAIHELASRLELNVSELLPANNASLLRNLMRGKTATVEQWLSGFSESQFVVTDSFHGTLFSVIFNKPFVAIANQERGVARFESFLDQVGLRHRLCYETDSVSKIAEQPIGWENVNLAIEKLRSGAIDFLQSGLEGNAA